MAGDGNGWHRHKGLEPPTDAHQAQPGPSLQTRFAPVRASVAVVTVATRRGAATFTLRVAAVMLVIGSKENPSLIRASFGRSDAVEMIDPRSWQAMGPRSLTQERDVSQ